MTTMDFINSINFPISKATATTYLYVSLTLLIAILVDNILRSYVRVPKSVSSKRALTFVTIVRSGISLLVYIIAANIIFALLGINLTPLLASAGIIGVILGISARPIIEDLITGVFLLTQHAIEVNDYIKVDDVEGYIESIGFRTMTVRTLIGATVIIPNGQVKKVINYSRHHSNVLINIPVKADHDIDPILKAAELALEQLKKDETIAPALYPGASVQGIDDFVSNAGHLYSVVQIEIVTSPPKRWTVGNRYRYLLKKEFEKAKLKDL
jgi:small-conductance mechanosensitive channel